MKTVYLVEVGSRYSEEPYEQKCVFATKEQAKEYIEKQKPFENLYHIREIAFVDNDYHDEFDYIINMIESSDDLDSTVVMRHIRSLWTAFCLHHNLDVDTAQYDQCMMVLWENMCENMSNPYSSLEYERFYNAMSKLLV